MAGLAGPVDTPMFDEWMSVHSNGEYTVKNLNMFVCMNFLIQECLKVYILGSGCNLLVALHHAHSCELEH